MESGRQRIKDAFGRMANTRPRGLVNLQTRKSALRAAGRAIPGSSVTVLWWNGLTAFVTFSGICLEGGCMNGAEANPNMDQKCPQCGAPLPSGVLAGLCPACLMKQGAAADTAAGPGLSSDPTPFQ